MTTATTEAAMRVVVLALAVAACSKGGDATRPAGPRDAVIAAWKADKLTPSPTAPATVGFGKDCQSSTVENLDVLVCSFASPAEAKAAEDQGLGWIGSVTGASQAHGSALIVIADRKKADPNGRMINRLMKLAPN
ncbi:MAG TPA: hypothetical protein VHW23_48240 [Kofleriaceae bacterium]|jgi:hypothetical protein|nr:hypothetical protein [Kofleriaceae bacterium]